MNDCPNDDEQRVLRRGANQCLPNWLKQAVEFELQERRLQPSSLLSECPDIAGPSSWRAATVTRLQSLTIKIAGDARPKQFCSILGRESLLASDTRPPRIDLLC